MVSLDDLEDLGTAAYDSTYKGGDTPLDYVMDFSILCDETGGKKKAKCSDLDITPRFESRPEMHCERLTVWNCWPC